MIGQTIGHYRVLEKIGEGGMGQVYLAEDTSLDRKVALKFLSEPLQQDPILRQRFLREAKLAAALDHPFICHIHEIGQADDGSDFIAMEFVEGQTLKERLQESPLSYREILQIGSEISEALERAHGKGIVHRDLKPANIMLTTEGRVKVMDFGLAKKVPIGEGSEAEITAALTKDQTTLGTLNYMSPEQLKGQEVDPRSDIFSFGIILYELLLGEHPFAGPTPVETVGAILNRDPQYPTGSQAGPGMVLHSTIQGMLAKDPSQRFQSIGEVRAELVQLREEGTPRRRQIVWLAGLAALLTVAIAVVSLILMQLPPAPIEVAMRQVTSDGNPKLGLATDGSLVYFTLVVGDLAAGPLHVVAASGGKSEAVGTIEKYFEVAWPLDITPDGMKLLLAGKTSDMKIRTLEDWYSLWIFPLPSGPPQRVGEVWASSAVWSPDRRQIAYTWFNELFVVDPEGGEPRRLLVFEDSERDNEFELFQPCWSPDGTRLRVTRNGAEIWEVGVDESSARQIDWIEGAKKAGIGWTPDGDYFLFGSAKSDWVNARIWAQPEAGGLLGTGDPVSLSYTAALLLKHVRLNHDGKTIYATGWRDRGRAMRCDPESKRWEPFWKGISAQAFDFSRDGQWVAYVTFPEGRLWKSRIDGSERIPLTDPEFNVHLPRWSPDGQRIVFQTRGASLFFGSRRIYDIPASGGSPRRLIANEGSQSNPSWSSDGGKILFVNEGKEKNSLKILNLETWSISDVPGSEGLYGANWSPDGRFFATHKGGGSGAVMLFNTETEVWEELYPEGGTLNWSPDSQYLFFRTDVDGRRKVLRIGIEDRSTVEAADFSHFTLADWSWAAPTPDGAILAMEGTSVCDVYAIELQWP